MRDLTGKRALITGGASGIGLHIAERLVPEDTELVLVDLNEQILNEAIEDLESLGAKVSGYHVDVTDTESIFKLRDRIHEELGPIDLLINNAGIVFGGAFLDVPLEKHMRTLRVNLEGLVATTYAFLPDLLSRPEAHLVNIASAAGLVGVPWGSTYASSKWAVIGLSESLRLELEMMKHSSVKVTIVCPSYVSTGLFAGATPPKTTSMLTPEGLAQEIVQAIKHDQLYLLTPWLVKLGPFLKGILPTRLFDTISWVLGASSSMQHWRGREQSKAEDRPAGENAPNEEHVETHA